MFGKRSGQPAHQQQKGGFVKNTFLFLIFMMCGWLLMVVVHLKPLMNPPTLPPNEPNGANSVSPDTIIKHPPVQLRTEPPKQTGPVVQHRPTSPVKDIAEIDDSYHIVFSTGCSEFQDWQSIGVYSSAMAVGQKGVITRIASGCKPEQEKAITHAMSHLPKHCRVHFAPNTKVGLCLLQH